MDRKAILEGYLDPVAFLEQNLSPELRFTYPAARIYTPKGFWTTRKGVAVNLARPDLAQIRFEEDLP
jgi:C-terminal processing protease CtpA/Prc